MSIIIDRLIILTISDHYALPHMLVRRYHRIFNSFIVYFLEELFEDVLIILIVETLIVSFCRIKMLMY